jgi:hypothetical protein
LLTDVSLVSGDGDKMACRKLAWQLPKLTKLQQQIALAIGLFFVGIIIAWIGVFSFNRYKAMRAGATEQKNFSTKIGKNWTAAREVELT